MANNTTLTLHLKKKWYDMIASGEKTEEYRIIKIYWEKRLLDYKALADYVTHNIKSMILYEFLVHGSVEPHIKDACAEFPRGLKVARFYLGYTHTYMDFNIKSITMGNGNPDWGAPTDQPVFIIKLGDRL